MSACMSLAGLYCSLTGHVLVLVGEVSSSCRTIGTVCLSKQQPSHRCSYRNCTLGLLVLLLGQLVGCGLKHVPGAHGKRDGVGAFHRATAQPRTQAGGGVVGHNVLQHVDDAAT